MIGVTIKRRFSNRSAKGTYIAQSKAAGYKESMSELAVESVPSIDFTFDAGDAESTMNAASPTFLFVKRLFDIVFSLVVIVILSPLFVLLAIVIKVDDPEGSAFFRQKRIGKNGKVIRIFKFRSMYADAHDHPERYLTREQMKRWLREQKVDDDPRITKVGKLIRKTSIDEFPQFVNVLIGDMSVIGPRPVTLVETYEYGPYRDEVLSVRPGITGWWQVRSRNDATWDNGKRQKLELWYVRHMSISLDARIFLQTFRAMLGGTGR